MVALARRLLLLARNPAPAVPRHRGRRTPSLGGAVGGSLLVHFAMWAALSTVGAMSVEVARPTTVEFTLAEPEPVAEPEPEPQPVAEPEPEPEPEPTPRKVQPRVVHARPAPKPMAAKPVATPAPEPPAAAPAPSEGSALPEAVEGGTLAVGRAQGSLVGTAPSVAPPAPVEPSPEPAPDFRGLTRGYLKDLTRALHARRDYPRAALSQRLQGTVLLAITIDPSGHIVDVSVKRSSGHALLDRAAINTVRKAGLLPKAPDVLAWKTRAVTLPISYALR